MNEVVYITGGSKSPSGGTKVMNDLANLFVEKGYESYVVPTDSSGPAIFLSNPAPSITVEEYKKRISEDDINIDFWPAKELYDVANKKKNKIRVFWQHGASLPKGVGFAKPQDIFGSRSPYTHYWNVSQACADYLKSKYEIGQMEIVHPFFDTEIMKRYIEKKNEFDKKGVLILARRGKKIIPAILKRFSPTQQVTVMYGPFHENEFLHQLLLHKFFVSVDAGIEKDGFNKYLFKKTIRKLISKKFREEIKSRGTWILPKGGLLGFPLPTTEAAMLGTVVIGFAMGGGLEWMNENNCFLAKDADYSSLFEEIDKAIKTNGNELENIRTRAFNSVSVFSKEHTWNEITKYLHLS